MEKKYIRELLSFQSGTVEQKVDESECENRQRALKLPAVPEPVSVGTAVYGLTSPTCLMFHPGQQAISVMPFSLVVKKELSYGPWSNFDCSVHRTDEIVFK